MELFRKRYGKRGLAGGRRPAHREYLDFLLCFRHSGASFCLHNFIITQLPPVFVSKPLRLYNCFFQRSLFQHHIDRPAVRSRLVDRLPAPPQVQWLPLFEAFPPLIGCAARNVVVPRPCCVVALGLVFFKVSRHFEHGVLDVRTVQIKRRAAHQNGSRCRNLPRQSPPVKNTQLPKPPCTRFLSIVTVTGTSSVCATAASSRRLSFSYSSRSCAACLSINVSVCTSYSRMVSLYETPRRSPYAPSGTNHALSPAQCMFPAVRCFRIFLHRFRLHGCFLHAGGTGSVSGGCGKGGLSVITSGFVTGCGSASKTRSIDVRILSNCGFSSRSAL